MRKEFSAVLKTVKKHSAKLINLVNRAKNELNDEKKIAALAMHIEDKILELDPKLDRAEVRSFSELITGIAGNNLREKQEEIVNILDADLPDCFRAFYAFEKLQKNIEILLIKLESIIKEWVANGMNDDEGKIENQITYLKMFVSINNMCVMPNKKDLSSNKKNFMMKVSI